ncbi:LamG domain-containing protein [Pedobacter sp.]
MNVCHISKSFALILLTFLAISACKKTAYVSGPPPVLDTTGAVAVTADPPPPPPPAANASKTMVFDGTTNYITVADHNDFDIVPGENFTITCWIRTSQWKNMPVIRKRDASNTGYELAVNTTPIFFVNMRSANGVNTGTLNAVTNLAVNEWYHFAMVYNIADRTHKTYVNGILQYTTTHADMGTLSFENAVDLSIGYSATQSRFLLGQLDDIRIWNKALSTTELTTDMTTKSVGNATVNLLAAWDFEQISGNSVPDVSENGHTGTITGTVVTGERERK